MPFKIIYEERPEYYRIFLSRTTEKQEELAYLKSEITVYARNSFKKLKSHGWNVLDIGCGNGYLSVPLTQFLSSFGKIRWFALEPSKNQLQEFKEIANSQSLKNIEFINKSFESVKTNRKFDFILASHSLYFIEDWFLAVKKMVELLDKDGFMVIALQAKENLFYEVCKIFLPKLSQKLHFVREVSEMYDLLNKNESKLGVAYRMEIVEDKLDISDCKKLNKNGIKMIEFFLAYTWKQIPENIKQEIIDYFAQKNDIVTKKVGIILIKRS